MAAPSPRRLEHWDTLGGVSRLEAAIDNQDSTLFEVTPVATLMYMMSRSPKIARHMWEHYRDRMMSCPHRLADSLMNVETALASEIAAALLEQEAASVQHFAYVLVGLLARLEDAALSSEIALKLLEKAPRCAQFFSRSFPVLRNLDVAESLMNIDSKNAVHNGICVGLVSLSTQKNVRLRLVDELESAVPRLPADVIGLIRLYFTAPAKLFLFAPGEPSCCISPRQPCAHYFVVQKTNERICPVSRRQWASGLRYLSNRKGAHRLFPRADHICISRIGGDATEGICVRPAYTSGVTYASVLCAICKQKLVPTQKKFCRTYGAYLERGGDLSAHAEAYYVWTCMRRCADRFW